MRKFLLLLSVILMTLPISARTLKGVVTEASSGNPIVGASVIVKGTANGISTDNDGAYSLDVNPGQTLVVSYVGMHAQEIKVTPEMKTLNIRMKDNSEVLDDVVVVGYGVTKKRDLAGSVSQIKAADEKAGVITTTAQLLKGRAAGVSVRQSSLEPGGTITVRVRGASSISSNNDPLYVIDGVQTAVGNQISPDDIESMEILKDAAATAIYGARGANGVVIITTKKGKPNKFTLDYSYDLSAKFLYNPWKLLTAGEEIQHAMQVWKDNGSSGDAPYTAEQQTYTGKGTDWVKEMTNNTTTQAHGIHLQGGSDRIRSAASLVYISDEGILPNTKFSRLSSRLNVDYNITDRVRAGVNGYIAHTNRNYLNMGTNASTDNSLYWIFMANPMNTPDGTNVFGEQTRKETAYYEIQNKDFNTRVNSAYVTAYGEADLLKCLTAKVQYTYSTENDKYQNYYNRETIIGSGYKGLATIENENSDTQQLDAVLTFHKKFGDIHDVKVIGGTTYIDNKYEYMGMQGHGFTTDAFSYNNMGAAATIDWIATAKVKKTNMSYFGRAEYVLMDRYILNASFRADGASNFGKDHKWGYFPSVSAAWQIGDENFMKFLKPTVNSFKLRASYGRTGNDGIGSYKSERMYSFEDVYLGGDGIIKGMYPSNAGNSALKWETTAQTDLGFDMTLLNNKIDVNFDWYNKKTTDLLNEINISTSTTGLSTTTGNNGSIQNRGWELYIKYNVLNKKDFSWNTTFNISQNKNKVLSISDPTYYSIRPHGTYNYEEYVMIKEGYPLSSIYGYVWDGIIQQGETYAPEPKAQPGDPKFVDLDGDGKITTADRKKIGNGAPDVVLGWGNNFRYRDFDFSFFIDGAFGNDLLNLTTVLLEDNDRLSICLDRWTKNNPSTNVIRTGWKKSAGLQYGSFVNSHYVENASFIRLSNVELGYTVPVKKLGIKFIKNCRFYVGAQRLFTITGYSGFDPEVSVNGSKAVSQGLDFNSYPAYRTFNCGAKITF